MRISIGISGSEADRDVLAWSAQYARQGDQVTLVHVYEKRSGVKYGWLRATRFNSDRHQLGAQLLAEAEKELSCRLSELAVPTTISVIGGDVADALVQEARRADMLVVGVGHNDWPEFLPKIDCSVVVVPAGWSTDTRPGHNVAVLCGQELPVAALDAAVDHARRTKMAVLVIQPRRTEDPAGTGSVRVGIDETEQAERLDMQVASWVEPGGPPIVTEVRNDEPLEQLRALARTLAVVVLPLEPEPSDEIAPEAASAIRAAVGELRIPALVVPSVAIVDGAAAPSEPSDPVDTDEPAPVPS